MHPESDLNPTPTPDTPSTPPATVTPIATLTRQRRMVPRWTAMTTGVAGLVLGATLLGGAAFAQTPSADVSSTDTPPTSSMQTQGFRQMRALVVDGSDEGGRMQLRPAFAGIRHAITLDTVAETLGLTPVELITQLEAGTALTDIITTQGSTVADVVDALVAEAQDVLDLVVHNGRMTQAEADERLAALPADLTERIESGMMLHRSGPGGRDGADCEPGMTPDAVTPDSGTDEDATPTTS